MAWDALGLPCTVFTGMSIAVVDERSRLVQPRLEYLREFVERDDWEIWRRLWDVLDRELIAERQRQLAETIKKK